MKGLMWMAKKAVEHNFDSMRMSLSEMYAALGGRGKVTNDALKAGAEPIHEQMLINASGHNNGPKKRTGTLYESIEVFAPKNQKIHVGVAMKKTRAFYAIPVEFGHGGPRPAPPHPFVRTAFDMQADNAFNIIREELSDAIDELFRK